MGRPYAGELKRLPATFAWAEEADLGPLQQAIRSAGLSPLRVIGSGGSLTCAHALADLHKQYTGHLAAVATPLEATDEPLNSTVATWLLSAGGGNADILAAAKSTIMREPRQIGVLSGRNSSPLAELCRRHPFVDLLLYAPPSGKDGFLATNSLLGFIALLTRAYATEFGPEDDWTNAVDHVKPLIADAAGALEAWEADMFPLWGRSTTLVLHGPSTRIGAIDLESKFTEAALGNVQIADYRNFAHGRHHWLAKRGETSSVLAFIASTDRLLAERTLDLIPADVPQARLVFEGGPNAAALASLLAALRITEWVGRVRGIDPGRPGVPEFGRKLYNLRSSYPRRVSKSSCTTQRETAAIMRKAGCVPDSVAAEDARSRWRNALAAFLIRLRAARFAGIVLDYDGTIVDTRRRTETMDQEMASELVRLLEAGVHIGIATGRGKSVRRDLRECLPNELWPLVIVGYYNGAILAPLGDDSAPQETKSVSSALRPVVDALQRQPGLSELVCLEERHSQITLKTERAKSENWLWEIAHQAVLTTGLCKVNITRSGHSVDIVVGTNVSKLNIVEQLRELIGDDPILAIGDRGLWPGNDHELLSEPFALSVDEINPNPETCWHLGKPGQRGPAVTLDYLSSLEAKDGRFKFVERFLQ